MRRKWIAFSLCLTLCMTAPAEGWAASVDGNVVEELSSQDEGTGEELVVETPVQADFAEVQDVAEDMGTVTEVQDSSLESVGISEKQNDQEDILTDSFDELSSGEEDSDTEDQDAVSSEPSEICDTLVTDEEIEPAGVGTLDSTGAVIVGAKDWVQAGTGWKLVKHTEAAAKGSEDELADDAAAENTETEEEATFGIVETEEASSAGTSAVVYYTAADGIVKINTTTVKGSNVGYYLFDENGIMVTGRKTVSAGTPGYAYSTAAELYFTEESTCTFYKNYSNVSKTPVSTDIGQQKKNYWLYQNGKFRLYGASGKNVSISSLNEKYKSQGYLKINGEYYCLKNDGTPRTGEWKINGSMYYLEPDSAIPGRMFREGWKKFVNEKGEKWVYYNRDSKGADRGKAVKYNGNVAITITPLSTKTKYLLDHNGYILKSKHVQTVDGSWYGSNSQGQIYKNQIVKYGNYRYYFTASGKQVGWKNMWKQVPSADNRYYYFGSTAGRISEKTGWQYVTWPSGKFLGWFYFQSNGEHYRDIMVSDYYFDKTGKLASGVTTVNGKTYFFEVSSNITRRGTMLKGTMISYNGNWYYAEADGQLANNVWKQIDGSWYRFENYVTQTNTFRWMGSTYGYLNSQGKFCTGWIIYSNSQNLVRYVNPNGGGFYNNTSAVIDGLRYYFDSNGYRINDLTSVYKGPYYLKADRVNGVMTVYDSTRTVPVKTIRISVGASGTETPLGTYSMTRGLRWQLLMGPSYGQYSTHVNGAGQGGIYVHSVSGSAANSYSLPAAQYNKLGTPASHGCIRTCVADAKWVYDNCNGATITIFDGTYEANEAFKGPLGRKQLEPLRYPYNYDPTDPAV